MIWRRKVPKRFLAETLPKNADGQVMAATFLSNSKYPTLKVKLENIEETVHSVSGAITRDPDTGYTARFSGHVFHTANEAMMVAMLEHSAFNSGKNGFTIDHHDPTGLWRALGVVEVTQVPTFMPKTEYKVDPSKAAISKQLKALKTAAPEATETLVGLAE